MNRNSLFALWGGLFVLCAGLGFLPEPAGLARFCLTALSVLFFLPPAVLLHQSRVQKDRDTIVLIRNLSAISLVLTLLTLSLNVMLAISSESLGIFLHSLLVVISSPMVCSGYWVLSLFLWACLLMVSLKLLKTLKK